jgi:hypothetical protein
VTCCVDDAVDTVGEVRDLRASIVECPRQESNLRTWLRRPMLYPLSYEGL